MIIGIGVDILHIPRFLSFLRRRGDVAVARRILHPSEFEAWIQIPQGYTEQKTKYLSTRCVKLPLIRAYLNLLFDFRWAVKEAAYKAFSARQTTTWKDWVYWHAISPSPPTLKYIPCGISSKKPLPIIHVSVSHDGEYVTAQVLAEEPCQCAQ